MRLFGYAKEEDAETLLELQEVTFAAEPHELRRAAEFLNWAAQQIEQHPASFGHRHLRDFEKAWTADCDVIVASSE